MPLKSSEQRFGAVCGMSKCSQRDSRGPASLSRGQALDRLRRQAEQDKLSLEEQSRRFVTALETLSAPGGS